MCSSDLAEAHEAVCVADDFNLVKCHQGVESAFILDGEIVRAALAVPICQCASPAQLGVSTWVQRYNAVIAARLSSSCGLTTAAATKGVIGSSALSADHNYHTLFTVA